jgi:NAD(P)-dependent dehydrogenase (short-subunit alcohol dehydrogenase family)
MSNIENKVAIVTGGAGLLGAEFCKAIVKNGGKVLIADLVLDAANAIADELCQSYPAAAAGVFLDITDRESIRSAIEFAEREFGRVDVLVNNAYPRNKQYGRKLEDVTYQDFCENVDMHLGGYFLASQQFSLFFQKQGHGNIINMSSIYGVIPPKFEIYADTPMTMPVEYAAIKSAILHLTKYFAVYYKQQNIRANCISPGGIFNQQSESFLSKYNGYCNDKGMLDPSDITGTLLFLISDASKYITGQNFVVDDGFSL